ncbi:T9SS type A sorting domain-containing protein [Polaribacter porphyrae]|uniref:Secretion system C-terminal sorting domain-containing protein n=1 Tax=Polaribacter porphyrae TaxID=1137780 RepID=A0A2S7WR10_9FLAO|nr:T9SS type A sorting domain-containing protein [Polaribacter porphyrae]PQJ80055.1 hypothetical protein BTO18_13120 [Polaribacter porphyrae]
MKKITLSILCLLFAVITTNAQITLVKDLLTTDSDSYPYNFLDGGSFAVFIANTNNTQEVWATDGTGANTVNIGTNINEIFNVFDTSIVFKNNLYFVIENADTGAELYKTDGTLAGTSILKDINNSFGSTPENFIIYKNELYFTADDGINGSQIWKTDGTEAGTIKVTSKVNFARDFIIYKNELFFTATDNVNGDQLWKTDGTDSGTTSVKIINGATGSSPRNFMLFNNEIFFLATTDAEGEELWKTDGTDSGTVLIKDIKTGNLGSGINNLTINNNNLLFTADDGINGTELWKSDGTNAGTVLVKDFSGDMNSTDFVGFKNLDATTTVMILSTPALGHELWKTDGTEAGSVLVKDINSGADSSFSQFSNVEPVILNNEIYFEANNGTDGVELWKSNGTEAGTIMVKNVNTNNSIENGKGLFGGLVLLNNKIIFEAFNTNTNRELWITDGSSAGTTILNDNNPGIGWGAYLDDAVVINGNLLFNGSNGNNGFEIWKTDGTALGTSQVKNIEDAPSSSTPLELSVGLGKLFFKADSTSFSNSRLFVTDGTAASTTKVVEGNKSVINPTAMTEFNGKLYFSSSDFSKDYGIFYTTASGDAIEFVKKINPNDGNNSGITDFFHAENLGALFFAANDGTNGKELWVSKGSESTTKLVKDINTGSGNSTPQDFFEFNNEVYFMTVLEQGFINRQYKKTLWKTDGTEAGTVMLKEFSFTNFNHPAYFTVYNSKLYFTAYDSSLAGVYFWTTDGTQANTKFAFSSNNFVRNPFIIDNKMFFSTQNTNEARKLWVYDGTTASEFKDFQAGNFGGFAAINNATEVVNGKYYFSVNKNNATSLWITDGSEAGTEELLSNISFIKEMVAAGDIVYLSLDDSINGTELWKSNGTVAGTEMVEDFYLGEDAFGFKYGADPSSLTVLGNTLYFAASSASFGRELFKLENAVLNINKEAISELEVGFNAYPNPTSSLVTISSENTIQKLEIFNLLGKKVATINTENKQKLTVDVSRFSTGIYIIKTKISDTVASKKLIIK